MNIKVLFFGILAEKAGLSEKIYSGIADTDSLQVAVAADVIGLEGYRYIIAVNRQTVNENIKLNDGDEVAFLPPFAGG